VACPRGRSYTCGIFEDCDPGYFKVNIPSLGKWGIGWTCICEEHIEEYQEEQKRVIPEIPGIPGLEKIFEYIPILIIAAIAIAVLGLFRR